MAFCAGCGSQVADGTAFCQKCGKPVAGGQAPSGNPHTSAPPATEGIQENIAGLICYAGAWLTGLIFFFIDKRPIVRFHAAQSIVVFGGLSVIYYIIRSMFYADILLSGWGFGWSFGVLLFELTELLWLVLWIFLMVKAYQGEKFRVPIAADIADNLVGKVKA